MSIALTALSTLGQAALQEKLRQEARQDKIKGEESFAREFRDLEDFQYTNPQALADSAAEAEKIAGAAGLAGDTALRQGALQNIAAASRDPRMAPQAAAAVGQMGDAAYQNMLRSAQFAMPYRARLAQSEAETQRLNEQFDQSMRRFKTERAAGSAERARQEERMARQEFGNALLTGGAQMIDAFGAKRAADLQQQYLNMLSAVDTGTGDTGDTGSTGDIGDAIGDYKTYEGATGDTPITISQNVDAASVDPRSVQAQMLSAPGSANLQYGVVDGQVVRTTPGSALQSNTSFASPISMPNMRARTFNLDVPQAPDLSTTIGGFPAPSPEGFNLDNFMQRPGGIQDEISIKTTGRNLRGLPEEMPSRSFGVPSEFGGMNNFLDVLGDYQKDSIANMPAGNTIDPSGQSYYNPGMGVADARLDYLSNYGQGSRGIEGLLNMLGSYEEGGGLPMMTPGEPSHETNEQRLIDKQTGAPIADLMGAETVLSDDQTEDVEELIEENDAKGLLKYMKKLFNKPQFKKQRAENENYKGREMAQGPQAPGPGGQGDPRMAIMQAMMQAKGQQ